MIGAENFGSTRLINKTVGKLEFQFEYLAKNIPTSDFTETFLAHNNFKYQNNTNYPGFRQ